MLKQIESVEASIQLKLMTLRLAIDTLRSARGEHKHLSLEKNALILCITSTVGTHFQNESLPPKKREAILDLANLVIETANQWKDQDDAPKKNYKLSALLENLNFLKDELTISSVRVCLRLFKAPEMSACTAAQNLVKLVEQFKESLNNNAPKFKLSDLPLNESAPTSLEGKKP